MRSRPTGPFEINYACPLVRKPIFISAFTEGGGLPQATGMGYRGPLNAFGAADWRSVPGTTSLAGTGGYTGASTDWRINFTGLTADVIPANRVTYAFLRKRDSGASGLGFNFGHYANASNANRAGAHLPFTDDTVYWDFGGVGAPNRLTWASTPTDRIEAWVLVAGERGSAIYFNGDQKAAQSTAVTRTQAVASIGCNFGNGINNAGGNQSILLFAAFDAEWTAAEARAWSDDPYCLISPGLAFKFIRAKAVAAAARRKRLPLVFAS